MKIPDDTQTICVVDDDEGFRDSLVWLLQAAGHRVASFASGEGFLSHWRPETPGCLLVDIRMPGMTGLELQVELERRGYGAPVIFITGHGDVPMAVRAMTARPAIAISPSASRGKKSAQLILTLRF